MRARARRFVRGLVVLAYFFVDWTALIPVASFGLAGILLFVAVAFHPGDDG